MALIKEVKRESLRKEWKAVCLIAIQATVVLLIVYQLLQVLGFRAYFQYRRVAFSISTDPLEYLLLALSITLLAALHFYVKKRQPRLMQGQLQAAGIIKETAKEKLKKAKKEPQAAALLVIEFLFAAIVVIALRAYLDPHIELIPWSEAGIGPPLTTIINAIIAVAVLAAFYWLYSYTSAYRQKR